MTTIDSTNAGSGSSRFDDAPPVLGANPFVPLTRAQVAAAVAKLAQRLVVEPGVATSSMLSATAQLVEVAIGRSDVVPARGDRRFADPRFQTNPLYRRIGQSYLVASEALLKLPDRVELDHKSRQRCRFGVQLAVDALAPTNTLIGNPSAISKAWQTRGASLRAGARNLIHDARTNGGMPSMVDSRPFRLGENIAATPGEVVHRSDLFELIQYNATTSEVHARPLVAIPPQINKYYISDIAHGRSLVEYAVDAGVPYFAVSWRNPTKQQRDWNLDSYVAACKEAIEVACEIIGSDDANALGICAGGVTLACLLGHLAAEGESLVNSATFLVAGLDTEVESMASTLATRPAIDAARRQSARRGVLDGRDLARVFAWLRPNDLVWNYWVNNYLHGENPPAFDILAWNADTTCLPAGLHADFLDLFETNGLARDGAMSVLGTPIHLADVKSDMYVVGALTDHIVPWPATFRSAQMFGGTTQFVLSTSGHIQAIVNPPGGTKSAYRCGPVDSNTTIDAWQASAPETRDSWWEHWTTWLCEHSGGSRPAPAAPGNTVHPAIEPAPGRYVRA